ncbi:MAG: hypothetical protein ACNYPE_02440 [Candidatus Azotimanducaceae bacterium WSBS_2022_MAG_OTU7]
MPSIKKILRPGYYRRKKARAEARREAEQKQREEHAHQLRHITQTSIDTIKTQEKKQREEHAHQLRHITQTSIDTIKTQENQAIAVLKNQENLAIAVLQNQEKHLIDFKNQIAELANDFLLENPEDWLNHKLQLSQTLPVAVLKETKLKQKIDSVLLELPESWVKDEFYQLNRPTTNYFVNVCLVLFKMNLNIEIIPRFGYSDAAPCLPADNQICLSFHSHGSEDRVWRVKESYIPPYFSFDKMGYSGFSELAQHPENFTDAIAQFPLEHAAKIVSDCKARLIENNFSKYDQPDISNTELPKDYIFYPLQQAVDTVAVLNRVHQSDAIWHLAEQSEKHGITLVIKIHPHCNDAKTQKTVDEVVQKYPNTHLLAASVNELIPNARAIVGANSGVLFEALIHGKPVYSFASSDFQLATIALQDKTDFAKVFAPPPDQTDDVVRFLGWYLIEYCFRSDNFEQLENKVKTCLKTTSLSTPTNTATRDYIKHVFRTLALARKNAITYSDTDLKT